LDWFRRSSSPDHPPRFAFYGKLPFDREFLRYRLDSPEGRWITSWVDGAHQIIAARREAGEPSPDVELRAIIAREGGDSALAALIRPSTDGGGRSYPSCAFCVLPAVEMRDEWHLSPLWLEPVWQSMVENILGSTASNRKDFDATLDQVPLEPVETDSISASFESASSAVVGQAWRALTAADAEAARALAVAFVQLGRVQRDAGAGPGGIALRIPLSQGDEPPPMQAAQWMRLFAAVSAYPSAWPAVIEVWHKSAPRSQSLCIFGREPTSDDLAHLLSGLGDSAIDDLRDAWDAEPKAEEDRRHLDVLLGEEQTRVADLWRKMV
jgi:type VI secretion system ImpM family protein